MTAEHDIFDRALLVRRRNRVAAEAGNHEFLLARVADDLIQNATPSEETGVAQALPPTPDEQQAAATSTPARVREGVLVGRFRFIYALLALLIGVSVGGFIVLWGHNSVSGPPWSAWVPTGSESQEMKDIARFVGAHTGLSEPIVTVWQIVQWPVALFFIEEEHF